MNLLFTNVVKYMLKLNKPKIYNKGVFVENENKNNYLINNILDNFPFIIKY